MPRSARDLGEDGFGFGGEAWLGLDGLAGDGDRDALEGSKCLHEALDADAGLVLEVPGDRERSEHDGEVGLDRFAFAVEDRSGLEALPR
ncbi:hypothetical protein SAMN05428934_106169 [Tessaracoccus flavus]|nr:hypothetical protein SAMN05428934_106169 [Tessaracoccus flavus]